MTRKLRKLAVLTSLIAACGTDDAGAPSVAIELFQANPATVAPGAPTLLTWSVLNADSVAITGGGANFTALPLLGTQQVLVGETTLFTLTASGGGAEVSQQIAVTVDGSLEGVAPVIGSFEADPDSVDPGGATTLSWSVTGATALKITGGEADIALEDEATGEREVTPAADTTFTLEATGPGGVATEAVTVTVRNPTITAFTANPEAAREGAPIRLEWTTTNADVITIEPDPDVGRSLEPQDAVDVFPGSGATTYTLTAANSAGGTAATGTVEVSVHNPPAIVAFTITPDVAPVGEPVFLAWQTTGVEAIEIQGLPEGTVVEPDRVQELDGYPVIAVESATFRLLASGPGGTTDAEVTLTVHATPVVDRFEADPPEMPLGGATTLRWSTSNADEVRITPAVSEDPLATDGSAQISPVETTVYRLTAIGPGGQEEETVEVVVHPPPVIDLFEATPEEVPEGGNVTLRWRTRDATSLLLDPDLGGNFPAQLFEGTFGVQPRDDTTYTLTALSGGGEVQATVSITVLPRPVVSQFRVSRNEVTFGEEVTLSWTTEHATTIELGPGLDVDPATVDGEHTFRPTATGSFVLSALGPGGRSDAQAVRVTVHPRPIIQELSAAPAVVRLGGESTLTWEVEHALRVWFDPGPEIAADAFEGSTIVRPDRTAEYVLHAESGHGEVLREVVGEVTVTVNQPPAVVRFAAEPPEVLVGGGTTLVWELTDADAISIVDDRDAAVDLGDAAGQAVGSLAIEDVRHDVTYTLSATGPGGALDADDRPSVQITVRPARLVVSEVFFDRAGVGSDRGWEWVELYNPTDVDVPLSPYSLGIGTEDWRASSVQLDGTAPAGGCIVVGGPNSGDDNHNPVFDVELFGNGFSPTLADEPTGVVAVGVHFLPQFFLPADEPGLVPLDAVLYGWRNTPGFRDHRGGDGPAEVTFQLYELNGDGTIVTDGGERVRRIQPGWSIARRSPRSDDWRPQDTPTPGVCFEDRPAPGPAWCQIQHPVDPVVAAPGGDTPDLFGRVYQQGVTEGVGQGEGVHAQVGFGPTGTHPDTSVFWVWADAAYNGDLLNDAGQLNDDEYISLISAPEREGEYAWAYRFRSDDQPAEWLYCDLPPGADGDGSPFDPASAGVLTVQAPQ